MARSNHRWRDGNDRGNGLPYGAAWSLTDLRTEHCPTGRPHRPGEGAGTEHVRRSGLPIRNERRTLDDVKTIHPHQRDHLRSRGSILAISGISTWMAMAIGVALVGVIVFAYLRSKGKADRSQ